MQHIPNLKYKTTMCNSWALGNFQLNQEFPAIRVTDVTSLTARQNFTRFNR